LVLDWNFPALFQRLAHPFLAFWRLPLDPFLLPPTPLFLFFQFTSHLHQFFNSFFFELFFHGPHITRLLKLRFFSGFLPLPPPDSFFFCTQISGASALTSSISVSSDLYKKWTCLLKSTTPSFNFTLLSLPPAYGLFFFFFTHALRV